MRTILVPTDFSATSQNSARYALGLANELGADKIVLYNAYSMPLATEMSWAFLQTEELQKASHENLNNLKEQLLAEAGFPLTIETISDFGFLQEQIAEIVTRVQADLIVMGITGGGKFEQVVMGSNTTHILHEVSVPVLIVPPNATYKPIEKIAWACDYKEVMKTTPAETIKQVLASLKARLVVVHNNTDTEDFSPELYHNNRVVADMFEKLEPAFVLVEGEDFAHAMDAFIEQHRIDIMLVVPKRHGWLSSLFRRSHTSKLAFHTHIPLLCVQSL